MNINEAVRALRHQLGDTQQSFAVRLGLAISTVVKYEASRTPRGAELTRFLELAIGQQRHDLAEVFARAMGDELNMKAERIPRTLEESLFADLLFLVMRNRPGVYGIDPKVGCIEINHAFSEVRRQLIQSFESLAARYRKGQDVIGLDPDDDEDLQILEAEVKVLKQQVAVEDSK